MGRKVANLDSSTLYEMGDAVKVQKNQLNSVEEEKDAIEDGLDYLQQINKETKDLAYESEKLLDELVSVLNGHMLEPDAIEMLNVPIEGELKPKQFNIKKTETIRTNNEWEKYAANFSTYAQRYGIDITNDPFSVLLSQREYEELYKEINDDFAKKTSIRNKMDLKFLAIAIALQVTKALLFPHVAEKAGYGESFNKEMRFDQNDKSIVQEESRTRDRYRDRKLAEGNEKGEWIELLYRTPPYDITKGSPAIGFNMEGRYHRIHTLGHDPILGWFFGTANILTDTVTFDTFVSHKVMRNPMFITSEKITFPSLSEMAIAKVKENPLNLPAALLAEKIHLKSDEFTKCGLPIPILETFAPNFAGNLYKNQYDTLCFSRDLKMVEVSAAMSLMIDMVIGLTHALYYDKEKDGTKNLFEVRTRKILLISSIIASASNIIYSAVTKNPKALDIGGLLVTLAHLFSDARFMLNIKKEFIENKIYEKIETEIKAIDESRGNLMDFECKYIFSI